MEKEFFRGQMLRLVRLFGVIDNDVKKEYSKLFLKCDSLIFEKTIDRIIETHRYKFFPLPSEILEILRDITPKKEIFIIAKYEIDESDKPTQEDFDQTNELLKKIGIKFSKNI